MPQAQSSNRRLIVLSVDENGSDAKVVAAWDKVGDYRIEGTHRSYQQYYGHNAVAEEIDVTLSIRRALADGERPPLSPWFS